MLEVLLLSICLVRASDPPWEPVPFHCITTEDKALRRDEFRPLGFLALSCIRIYQRTISPYQGDVCNFVPSCSQYGYQAIKRHGLLCGVIMAADRLTRCNFACWKYYPRYYEVRWVEGRGLKLYDPPEKNWLFVRDRGRPANVLGPER